MIWKRFFALPVDQLVTADLLAISGSSGVMQLLPGEAEQNFFIDQAPCWGPRAPRPLHLGVGWCQRRHHPP